MFEGSKSCAVKLNISQCVCLFSNDWELVCWHTVSACPVSSWIYSLGTINKHSNKSSNTDILRLSFKINFFKI